MEHNDKIPSGGGASMCLEKQHKINTITTHLHATGLFLFLCCSVFTILVFLFRACLIGKKKKNTHTHTHTHVSMSHRYIMRFGVPVLWFTFCPSDTNSRMLLHFCGHEFDLEHELPCMGTYAFRKRMVASHPAAAAKFFNRIVNAFITCLLGYEKRTPAKGLVPHSLYTTDTQHYRTTNSCTTAEQTDEHAYRR